MLSSCGDGDDVQPPLDSTAVEREPRRDVVVAESIAAARDEWNKAEVVKRLSEAGLVVSDRKELVEQPFLSVPGAVLTVSESELQIYVYPSNAAREAESRKLDSARVAPPTMMISWREPAHLILSGKLLAIHLTRNDHLAERVADALTARHTGLTP